MEIEERRIETSPFEEEYKEGHTTDDILEQTETTLEEDEKDEHHVEFFSRSKSANALLEDDSTWYSWRKTSLALLQKSEQAMLAQVKAPIKQFSLPVFVNETNYFINTIFVDCTDKSKKKNPPLVLMHGFGGGLGFWIANLDSFAQNRQVFAFDTIGFGRSTRENFPYTPDATTQQITTEFVQFIHAWTEAIHLKQFILLGHSFGAYLATLYTISHPSSVIKLILADPWGIPIRDAEADKERLAKASLKFKVFAWGASKVPSPLSGLRAAGPLARGLIRKIRPDIPYKFSFLFHKNQTPLEEREEGVTIPPPEEVIDYMYHLNAQTPASGEGAFWKLVVPIGAAADPLRKRFVEIEKDVSISFIYGEDTWMDINAGYAVVDELALSGWDVDVGLIKKSGHHVYVDNWLDFNALVNDRCASARKIPKQKI